MDEEYNIITKIVMLIKPYCTPDTIHEVINLLVNNQIKMGKIQRKIINMKLCPSCKKYGTKTTFSFCKKCQNMITKEFES